MRAAVLHSFGGPENFEIADIPIPEVKPGTVLIKNSASGIHYADVRQREGVFPFSQIPMPAVVGFQVAGTVVEVGEGVDTLQPGARVAASLLSPPETFGKESPGGYAEFSLANAETAIEIPDRIGFDQAVAWRAGFSSAYVIYHKYQPIAPDATVLVYTGAGALGLAFTQIAKRAGNTVISVVRDDAKAGYCRDSGADHVVNMTREGWVEEVRELTGGRGVDATFNTVCGDTIEIDIDLLTQRGKLFVTSTMQGWPQNLSEDALNRLTMKNLALQFTRTAENARAGAWADEAREQMVEYMRESTVRLPVTSYPLEKVAQAHRDLQGGALVGKGILVP